MRKLKASQWVTNNLEKQQEDAEMRIEKGSRNHRRHALNQFRRYLDFRCEGRRLIERGMAETGAQKKNDTNNQPVQAQLP